MRTKAVAWLLACGVFVATAAEWNSTAIADESTIEFLTVVPEEGEHWLTVCSHATLVEHEELRLRAVGTFL